MYWYGFYGAVAAIEFEESAREFCSEIKVENVGYDENADGATSTPETKVCYFWGTRRRYLAYLEQTWWVQYEENVFLRDWKPENRI